MNAPLKVMIAETPNYSRFQTIVGAPTCLTYESPGGTYKLLRPTCGRPTLQRVELTRAAKLAATEADRREPLP
jgi:hypothetical protein